MLCHVNPNLSVSFENLAQRSRQNNEVVARGQAGEDQAREGSMDPEPAPERSPSPQRVHWDFEEQPRRSREYRPWPPRPVFNAFGTNFPRRRAQEDRGGDRLRGGDVPDARQEDTPSGRSTGELEVQPAGQSGREGPLESVEAAHQLVNVFFMDLKRQ